MSRSRSPTSTISASGLVKIAASAAGTIYTVGVAGGATYNGSGSQGGFQFAGAGVVMINTITGDIEVTVTNGSLTSGIGTPRSDEAIELQATDGTSINADAGAAGILLNFGKSSSSENVAIGAAVAVNSDSRTIQATTDGTTLDAGGALNVTSTSSASITTWAIGHRRRRSRTGGGGGISFAGAGSGAGATPSARTSTRRSPAASSSPRTT